MSAYTEFTRQEIETALDTLQLVKIELDDVRDSDIIADLDELWRALYAESDSMANIEFSYLDTETYIEALTEAKSEFDAVKDWDIIADIDNLCTKLEFG